MSESVTDPSETVSRYLFKDDIRSDETIRYQAFLPSSSNPKISVFRVFKLSEQEIWALAVEKVEPIRRKRVTARGDLSIAQVQDRKLVVQPDAETTSRHANIVGWPPDRDERATIAKDIAAIARVAKRQLVTEINQTQ